MARRCELFLTVALGVVAFEPMAAMSQGTAPAGQRVSFANAGIKLTVPDKFEFAVVAEPVDLMRAVLEGAKGMEQGITLVAFPVAEDMTPQACADELAAQMGKSLVIRRLKILKTVPMRVAGLDGLVQLMSFDFRGVPTVASRVYFIRQPTDERPGVGYILTVEAPEEHQSKLLPSLGAVVRTVELGELSDPISIRLSQPSGVIEDHARGCAMSVPLGWFGALTANGIMMSQTNYLTGGRPSLTSIVAVADVPAEQTGEGFAKQSAEAAAKAGAERNLKCEIVSQGPAKMGDADAYQIILKRSMTSPEGKAGGDMVAQRSLVVPGADGAAGRCYNLVIMAGSHDSAALQEIMAKLAEGFVLLDEPPAATAPTSETAPAETAPTSAPATRRPATGATMGK